MHNNFICFIYKIDRTNQLKGDLELQLEYYIFNIFVSIRS